MTSRRFALILSFAGMLLTSALTVAYAYNSQDSALVRKVMQRNELVFNWGSSS
mgnify:CR=1 FL=1